MEGHAHADIELRKRKSCVSSEISLSAFSALVRADVPARSMASSSASAIVGDTSFSKLRLCFSDVSHRLCDDVEALPAVYRIDLI